MGNYASLVWKSSDVAPAPTIGNAYEGQDVSGNSIIATEASVIETVGGGIGNADIVDSAVEKKAEEAVVEKKEEGEKKEEVVADLVKDSAVLNPTPQQSPKMNGKRKNKKGKHH